jgi:hypothetical protein
MPTLFEHTRQSLADAIRFFGFFLFFMMQNGRSRGRGRDEKNTTKAEKKKKKKARAIRFLVWLGFFGKKQENFPTFSHSCPSPLTAVFSTHFSDSPPKPLGSGGRGKGHISRHLDRTKKKPKKMQNAIFYCSSRSKGNRKKSKSKKID